MRNGKRLIACAAVLAAAVVHGAEKWPETPPPTGKSVTWAWLNALDLGSRFVYHPYWHDPDSVYQRIAEPLRKLVKSYSGAFDVMQGEAGCPA